MEVDSSNPIKSAAKKRGDRPRLNILVAFLSIATLTAGFYTWRSWKKPSLQRYDRVIALLDTHHLKLDGGRADLSKIAPGVAPRDEVFAEYRDDGTFAAMFPTYFGEGDETAGLLYSSRPLTEDDTSARLRNAIHFDQRSISVGPYHYLLLDERINDNWYHVSYKLH